MPPASLNWLPPANRRCDGARPLGPKWSARYKLILWKIRQSPVLVAKLAIFAAIVLVVGQVAAAQPAGQGRGGELPRPIASPPAPSYPAANQGTGYPRQQLPPPITYPRDPVPSAGAADESAGQGRREEAPQRATTTPPTTKDSTVQSAEQLLAASAAMLASQGSINAGVRLETRLFDQHLVGKGRYLQGYHGARLWRFELLMRDEGRESLALQVCDARYVWIYDRLDDHQRLWKVDLQRVNSFLDEERKARAPHTLGLTSWGLGGLPQLITGLNEAFVFRPPQQTRFRGNTAWRLEGTWRQEALCRLLPDQKEKILQGKPPDFGKLSQQLPQRVVVILSADLFPQRIEYLRESRLRFYEFWKDDAPIVIAAVEFFDVKLGLPIDPRQFTWQATGVPVIDYTDDYLDNVKQLAEVMREAGRAGGSEKGKGGRG
jgi:hypothetical protein